MRHHLIDDGKLKRMDQKKVFSHVGPLAYHFSSIYDSTFIMIAFWSLFICTLKSENHDLYWLVVYSILISFAIVS